MSIARLQISKVFEDLKFLLFELGIFLGTDPTNCTRVVFWEDSGMVRKILTHKNGQLHGFYGKFYDFGHPEVFAHYRNGQLYGETQFFDSKGLLFRHVLHFGKGKKAVAYTEKGAQDFSREYRFSNEEWNLAFDFYDQYVRGWYKP